MSLKKAVLSSLFLAFLLTGCATEGVSSVDKDNQNTSTEEAQWISATVVGSTDQPDPILEKAKEFEKKGMAKIILIMKSLPVKIKLEAPQAVIDELNAMPKN